MRGFKRFFTGSTYFFRGLGTLLGGGGLRRWAVLPVVVNFFVFVGIGALTLWTAWRYASQIAEGGWGTLWGTLAVILTFLAVLVIGFFAFGMVATVVAAPFNELISQATERRFAGSTGEVKDRAFAADMLRAAWAATKLFLMEMAVIIPAMVLLLIPVAGQILFALPAAFFLALAYLDYPLDRRKLGLRQKLAFGWRHLPEVMGFGLVTYLAMLVPILNVLMIPVAAVGATRLFLDVSGKELAGYSPPAAVPGEAASELPAPSSADSGEEAPSSS